MLSTRALRFHEFGKPTDILNLEETSLAAPDKGKVLLRMLMAPINPSDIGVLLGKYGNLPELPATAGREGVGEVVEVGEGVRDFQEEDRVIWPRTVGSWQTHCVVAADTITAIPRDIPVEMAAMASINPPTAWRVLRDAHLQPGEWVIQNAANSAVGIFVIQMARHLQLNTINVVRREELREPLQKLGANVVLLEEDEEYPKRIAEITEGGTVRLALNSIGGVSAMRLIDSLSPGGTMVTIGAMDFTPVRFPTRQLIFEDVRLTGFWMDRWLRRQSQRRVQVMMDKLYSLMREGVLQAPVAETYPLDKYKEALKANTQPRLGKVLFRGDS